MPSKTWTTATSPRTSRTTPCRAGPESARISASSSQPTPSTPSTRTSGPRIEARDEYDDRRSRRSRQLLQPGQDAARAGASTSAAPSGGVLVAGPDDVGEVDLLDALGRERRGRPAPRHRSWTREDEVEEGRLLGGGAEGVVLAEGALLEDALAQQARARAGRRARGRGARRRRRAARSTRAGRPRRAGRARSRAAPPRPESRCRKCQSASGLAVARPRVAPADRGVVTRVGEVAVERPAAADEPARVGADRLRHVAARRRDRAQDRHRRPRCPPSVVTAAARS